MGRKDIIQIAVIATLILILSLIVVSLTPVWVGVGMVNPRVFAPLSRLAMQRMTRQMMRGMMNNRRQ